MSCFMFYTLIKKGDFMNLQNFDAIEVWPTLIFDDPNTGLYKETGDPEDCLNWEDFENCIGVEWTVFGHLTTGGSCSICACESQDDANYLKKIFEKLIVNTKL